MIRKLPDCYELHVETWLPKPPAEVFPFFTDVHNLARITPRSLRFRVLTPDPIALGVGTLVEYRIRILGIPIHWQSRIDQWDPPYRFVDVQLKGPYRLWHHEHVFEEHEGGTIVRDRVQFRAPGGPLLHHLFVNRDVSSIFRHRQQKLHEIFPSEVEELPPRTSADVAK